MNSLLSRATTHLRFAAGRGVHRALRRDQDYVIGNIEVALPPGHRLPYFQAVFPTYDRYFIPILQSLSRARRVSLVDVGANVGDTAVAALQVSESISVVSVEGSKYFLEYLRRNVAQFGSRVRVVSGFVGPLPDGYEYEHNGSTGGFSRSPSSTPPAEFVAVEELLSEPADLRIWKSDTDGFDLHLAVANWDAIIKHCGVLWIEFDPVISQGPPQEVDQFIDLVADSGRTVWLFDNVGNKMCTASGDHARALLHELCTWMVSQERASRSVPYLDLWIFDEESLMLLS